MIRELASRGYRQRIVARKAQPLIVRLADVQNLERLPVSGIVSATRALRGAAIAHAHEGRCVQAAALAYWTMGVPYVITRRVVRPLGNNPVTKAMYRNAAQLVGLSRSIASQLRDYAPGSEIDVIPSAFTPAIVDESTSKALRRRFGPGPIVGHVGALIRDQKGHGTLIAAARQRPGMQFVFVGSGEDEAKLKDESRDLGNVHFTGQVTDVASHLAAFDIFAFPSLFEGLGSILLDAMHAGLPIVATEVGGIPDIIGHEYNGLLIPPSDPDALVAALDRIDGDDALCERFARANREEILKYSSACMADRYVPIYQRLMSG